MPDSLPMTGVAVVRMATAWGLGLVLLTACSANPSAAAPPSYCAPTGAGHEQFWELVHASCRIVGDGDSAQAEKLRQALEEVPDAEVAAFQRTLVR